MIQKYNPIGVIHTPFKKRAGMPIQPSGGCGLQGFFAVFSGADHANMLNGI
jgi:hypothetical protein